MNASLPRSAAVVLVGFAIGVAGCGMFPIGARPPAPEGADRPCEAVFSAARCQAMLTAAAEGLGVSDEEVTAIEIAPDPTPRTDGVLEVHSGGRPIVVLAHVGGAIREVPMCMGIPSGPACMDEPAWEITTVIGAGYADVPCAGEPPDGCATPVPGRERAAIMASNELRIDHRVIPVPDVGRHEVRLGTATLANGVLIEARGTLVNPWPAGVRLSSEGIRLVVRSLVPGRPAFMNIYEHGWYPGTEAVEVLLVYEARHVEPGATIEIRDVVVG